MCCTQNCCTKLPLVHKFLQTHAIIVDCLKISCQFAHFVSNSIILLLVNSVQLLVWYPHRPIILRFSDISLVNGYFQNILSLFPNMNIWSFRYIENIDFLNKKYHSYKKGRCDKIQLEYDHINKNRVFMKAVLQITHNKFITCLFEIEHCWLWKWWKWRATAKRVSLF